MKLSVVVVVYNMQREAPRTLYSLSTAYQQGIAGEDYEVIVVENGSTLPLDPEQIRGLKGNFRYHFLSDASPSPAPAVNFGMRQAQGDVIAVMIDGARICTPGLLNHALAATHLYSRTVVATIGFYLGPEYQRYAIMKGYGAAQEDKLLEQIGWPADGYRLFEIGCFDESCHWTMPIAESNALFMHKTLWAELGGMDERFDEPGGGFVNLDTYYRALRLPQSHTIQLLGEGTFHQVHGGVATNAHPELMAQNYEKWNAHYRQIRGMDFNRAEVPCKLFGPLPTPAHRHLASAMPHVVTAQEQLAKLGAQHQALQAERDSLRQELDTILRSRSWHMTTQVRSVYRSLRSLRHRLSSLM